MVIHGPYRSRKQLSLKQKVTLVNLVNDRIREGGLSEREACSEFGIARSTLRDMAKNVEKYQLCIKTCINKAKKINHSGRKPKFYFMEQELLDFCFDVRSTGLQLTTMMIQKQACLLSNEFSKTSFRAQYEYILKFVCRNSLVF